MQSPTTYGCLPSLRSRRPSEPRVSHRDEPDALRSGRGKGMMDSARWTICDPNYASMLQPSELSSPLGPGVRKGSLTSGGVGASSNNRDRKLRRLPVDHEPFIRGASSVALNGRASGIFDQEKAVADDSDAMTGLVLSDSPAEGSRQRFPMLDELRHFHYRTVSLNGFKVFLDPVEADRVSADSTGDSTVIFFKVEVYCNSRWWFVFRDYNDFRTLDTLCHRCIYNRSLSRLDPLPAITVTSLQDVIESGLQLKLSQYLDRLLTLGLERINCAALLSWFELDSNGEQLHTSLRSGINVQAVAAAHVIHPFKASQPDELPLVVGTIVSIIDMPSSQESNWWRGKKGLKVGFFPSDCVELIEKGSQTGNTSPPTNYKARRKASFGPHQCSDKPSILKKEDLKKSVRLFGGDLGGNLFSLQAGQALPAPRVVMKCTEFVEKFGAVPGVYRLNGVNSNIQRLKQQFENATPSTLPNLEEDDIFADQHCVGSLCKLYFRELPNPLLTYDLFNAFCDAVQLSDSNACYTGLARCLGCLPPPHLSTLEFLMRHLNKIAQHSDVTGMHARNLSIVWAPNLLKAREEDTGEISLLAIRLSAQVIEWLIERVDWFFGEDGRAFMVADDPPPAIPQRPNFEPRSPSNVTVSMSEEDKENAVISRRRSLTLRLTPGMLRPIVTDDGTPLSDGHRKLTASRSSENISSPPSLDRHPSLSRSMSDHSLSRRRSPRTPTAPLAHRLERRSQASEAHLALLSRLQKTGPPQRPSNSVPTQGRFRFWRRSTRVQKRRYDISLPTDAMTTADIKVVPVLQRSCSLTDAAGTPDSMSSEQTSRLVHEKDAMSGSKVATLPCSPPCQVCDSEEDDIEEPMRPMERHDSQLCIPLQPLGSVRYSQVLSHWTSEAGKRYSFYSPDPPERPSNATDEVDAQQASADFTSSSTPLAGSSSTNQPGEDRRGSSTPAVVAAYGQAVSADGSCSSSQQAEEDIENQLTASATVALRKRGDTDIGERLRVEMTQSWVVVDKEELVRAIEQEDSSVAEDVCIPTGDRCISTPFSQPSTSSDGDGCSNNQQILVGEQSKESPQSESSHIVGQSSDNDPAKSDCPVEVQLGSNLSQRGVCEGSSSLPVEDAHRSSISSSHSAHTESIGEASSFLVSSAGYQIGLPMQVINPTSDAFENFLSPTADSLSVGSGKGKDDKAVDEPTPTQSEVINPSSELLARSPSSVTERSSLPDEAIGQTLGETSLPVSTVDSSMMVYEEGQGDQVVSDGDVSSPTASSSNRSYESEESSTEVLTGVNDTNLTSPSAAVQGAVKNVSMPKVCAAPVNGMVVTEETESPSSTDVAEFAELNATAPISSASDDAFPKCSNPTVPDSTVTSGADEIADASSIHSTRRSLTLNTVEDGGLPTKEQMEEVFVNETIAGDVDAQQLAVGQWQSLEVGLQHERAGRAASVLSTEGTASVSSADNVDDDASANRHTFQQAADLKESSTDGLNSCQEESVAQNDGGLAADSSPSVSVTFDTSESHLTSTGGEAPFEQSPQPHYTPSVPISLNEATTQIQSSSNASSDEDLSVL